MLARLSQQCPGISVLLRAPLTVLNTGSRGHAVGFFCTWSIPVSPCRIRSPFYLQSKNGLSTAATCASRRRATVRRFKLFKQCTRNGQLGGSPCLVTQHGNCLVGEGSSGLDVYARRTEYGLMLDNTASYGSDETCRTTGIYSLHIRLDLVSALMAFNILVGRSGLASTDTLFYFS